MSDNLTTSFASIRFFSSFIQLIISFKAKADFNRN